MTTRSPAWAMLAALVLAAGGCAQLAGFPERSAARDAPDAPDGSGIDGEVRDGAVEVSDARGDSPADTGGADGVDGADVLEVADGGASFCTGKTALFCEDFEESSLATRWPTIRMPSPGTLQLDDAAFVPPPTAGHSLLVDSPSGGDVGYLEGGVATTVHRAVLSFSFRADALPSEDTTYAAQIKLGECLAAIYVLAGNTVVQQVCPDGAGGHAFKDKPAVTAIPSSTTAWTDVELVVDVDARTATLRLNGFEVVADDLLAPWGSSAPSFAVGVLLLHPATPAHRRFHYDNLLFDGK